MRYVIRAPRESVFIGMAGRAFTGGCHHTRISGKLRLNVGCDAPLDGGDELGSTTSFRAHAGRRWLVGCPDQPASDALRDMAQIAEVVLHGAAMYAGTASSCGQA